MQGMQNVFERYEIKYMLTMEQYRALRAALCGRMEEDAYGLHSIANLYMDTADWALIRESIDKPIYKEKLRLRSYGIPGADSQVFLELKKKYKGVVYKRRAPMTVREADAFLCHGIRPHRSGQILREIAHFHKQHGYPVPRAFISYERRALFSPAQDALRITFDRNILFRSCHLDLTAGVWGTQLLDRNQVLMEVKVAGAMPLWLSGLLSELSIFPRPFSKYGACYQAFIHPHGGRKEEMANVS